MARQQVTVGNDCGEDLTTTSILHSEQEITSCGLFCGDVKFANRCSFK